MIGLDKLLRMDRPKLILRWRKRFGSSPPKYLSTSFLLKVLAHDLQCQQVGNIHKRTQRVLQQAIKSKTDTHNGSKDAGKVGTIGPAPTALSPGVQLVREWNGRTWQVDVLEDGFVCRGERYRSLSAIARMITGTRWSGPRFFGLT